MTDTGKDLPPRAKIRLLPILEMLGACDEALLYIQQANHATLEDTFTDLEANRPDWIKWLLVELSNNLTSWALWGDQTLTKDTLPLLEKVLLKLGPRISTDSVWYLDFECVDVFDYLYKHYDTYDHAQIRAALLKTHTYSISLSRWLKELEATPETRTVLKKLDLATPSVDERPLLHRLQDILQPHYFLTVFDAE